MSVATRERGMELVKTSPMNLELISETTLMPASGVRSAGRFQVIVEYAEGVCISAAIAESPEEAVEAFMVQMPGCDEGEITLFDRREQRIPQRQLSLPAEGSDFVVVGRIVASVKWKMSGTEIGLRVPHRQNVFHDSHLGLIALEVRNRRSVAAKFRITGPPT